MAFNLFKRYTTANLKHEIIEICGIKLKFKNKYCKVKQVAVIEDLELFRLIKFINNYSIIEFLVIEDNNNIGFRFTEFELCKIYEKTNPATKIKDIKCLFKVGF